eukprot:TRINITY_DN2740_c0_g1_i1.p1 TRINITY_DN2740_c0_g1~~TRINITY_DN2740_c0_g1_i1.p1  ORF type:complete len:244 (-),score=16.65 TRINITY_DN2740_c0_g1_i1:131-862(-)
MGNTHVFLRMYDQGRNEPMFSKISIGEFITWKDLQNHAFMEFRSLLGRGVDACDIIFTTQLETSNREILISDGDQLRRLFHDFQRMENHGQLAVLDVKIARAAYQRTGMYIEESDRRRYSPIYHREGQRTDVRVEEIVRDRPGPVIGYPNPEVDIRVEEVVNVGPSNHHHHRHGHHHNRHHEPNTVIYVEEHVNTSPHHHHHHHRGGHRGPTTVINFEEDIRTGPHHGHHRHHHHHDRFRFDD